MGGFYFFTMDSRAALTFSVHLAHLCSLYIIMAINRDFECEKRAVVAGEYIYEMIGRPVFSSRSLKPPCLVLGSGWGKSVELQNEIVIPFKDIPGLDGIPKKEGHEHMLKYGFLAGVPVFV